MGQPVFLYDGDCAFCSRSAQFVLKRIRTDAAVVPWQGADLEALGVRREDAEAAIQWVEPGMRRAGPDAVAVLLRRAQWYWKPAGWVLSNVVASRLTWPLYRLVARNRGRLPGGTAACALPQAQR
ncbi:thiol-disulfide oxidoreductase DCC family protein [Natronoglycomyces albus]|uniref:DUF393 domain-containing protein n=1 Tax=Natronoglycomyces albus TaxID=2811108 RepID=A0A895XU34_9ACTN|nr:DUF393 domain-containing protein [Natronoglycomyces albus]QSB06809.1 DUF393 domain-containing protein [Natronoglycomyces albus]